MINEKEKEEGEMMGGTAPTEAVVLGVVAEERGEALRLHHDAAAGGGGVRT